MNDDASKDTVSTSDLLDLIQADVSSSDTNINKNRNNTNGFRSNSYTNNDITDRQKLVKKDSFNRVRLTPHSSAQTRSVLRNDDSDTFLTNNSEEDDTVTDFLDSYSVTSGISTVNQRSVNSGNTKTRQRMPLDGGYGGMFAPGTGTRAYSASRMQVHYNNEDANDVISQTDEQSNFDGVSALTSLRGDDDQTTTTGYTLTSKIFSALRGNDPKRKTNNPYSSVGNASTTQTISSSTTSGADTSIFTKLALFYLNMPFRLRYFVQLFSILAVLMIASLNYFIAMEHVPMDGSNNNHLSSLEKKAFVGGGASTIRIPRLRVRNPMKFLHADYRKNKLMDRATEKFEQSSRYKGKKIGDQSPFQLGWKSMPRQIFNDFETGLSDDSKTIQHANAAKNKRQLPPKGTVAYVLPLTSCSPPRNNALNFFPYSPNQPKDDDSFRDFAVMLRSMIHAQSYQNMSSESRYDYKMHAIIHPQAKNCAGTDMSVVLQNLGYHVSVKSSPVGIHQLKHFDAAAEILKDANDASDRLPDFARLHAYQLEEYDAVVMVDFDTLVLGSVDEALDLIVGDKNGGASSSSVDSVFSWEHIPLMAHPEAKASVINLSFFALRPSKEMYELLVKTLKQAPFSATRGWGSTGRGAFTGWMTTQGFLTYFYDEVRNGAKVELSQCAFGNTAESSPSKLITNGGTVDCDSSPNASNQCNDCSKTTLDEVRVADLSYCLAPWECGGENSSTDNLMTGLCRQYNKKWFGGRLQMEDVHPQLQKTIGKLCIDGQYQPMVVSEH
eukprot:scaffold8817_cov148-Skeletonema_menzelii.AAC.11